MRMLSIGMACANDPKGLWATLVFLRTVNRFLGEIIVVDNFPSTALGASVRAIALDYECEYIPFDQDHGTSQPRNEVFRRATGKYVLCIDSHITMPNLGRLAQELAQGSIAGDHLWHGPIRLGYRSGVATHFRDEWGPDGMWGRWGLAWQKQDRTGPIFDVRAEFGDQGGRAMFQTVEMDPQPIDLGIDTPYLGSHQVLVDAGYSPIINPGDSPFPIPGMGLGLFLAKRESWLGFHPLARKFGGEEMTIHEAYRDAGREVFCIPWMPWDHFFAADKTNPGYELPNADRARNYILQINPLKKRDKHWPRMIDAMNKLAGAEQVAKIVADPERYPIEPCATCGKSEAGLPYEAMSADDLMSMVRHRPRDFDKQVDNLLEQTKGMERITAIVKRREWDVVLLAGGAAVTSYNREADTKLRERCRQLFPGPYSFVDNWPAEIEETDCLVVDTIPTGEVLYGNLTLFAPKVTKRIVIHATTLHGNNGEGGKAGMFLGLTRFLKENPEWLVVDHNPTQFGMTVISREPQLRKPLPGILTKAANFAAAMATHVASGMVPATEEQADIRLSTCSLCKFRNGPNCSVCGCVLELKATLASSECPLGHWAIAEAEGHPIVPISS